MNEDIIIFSLNLSLSLLLSLFLSLSLNVEPPWEGGGAILGTTPHPAMLLNINMISLSIITMSIFITNHHSCEECRAEANEDRKQKTENTQV